MSVRTGQFGFENTVQQMNLSFVQLSHCIRPTQSRFRTDGPCVPADANWSEGLVFH
jgi:hypothetical protein